MHCWDAATIGHQLCLAHLQRNLFCWQHDESKGEEPDGYTLFVLSIWRTFSYHWEDKSCTPESVLAVQHCLRSGALSSERLNGLDRKSGLARLHHGVSYFSASFFGMFFILFRINIHNDERMNTSGFKTHTLVFYTSQDKRLEFVCCFSHDSLIRLLSDHLYPKGKPILSSCPFTVQREHTDISAAENIKLSPSWQTSISVSVLTLQHGD